MVRAAEKMRCVDSEVKSIMEAGMVSLEWVAHEFSGVRLGDARLDKRLVKTAMLLAKSPGLPINGACRTWAETQASYRLFDNPKARMQAILAPHFAATAHRIAQVEGRVLLVQDTVFFSYGQHPNTKGLGPIGKSNSPHERGLVSHNALAFTTGGVPLGLLSQQIWAREEVPEEEAPEEKTDRLQLTPIEKKESFKWLLAQRESYARVPQRAHPKLITVADRESDVWEFVSEAKELKRHFLIRARVDRTLVSEDSECYDKLVEALAAAPRLGEKTVHIPGNGQRKARTAEVEIRAREVTLKAPQRRGAARASASSEPVTVTALQVLETHPPKDEEPIAWVLLTDLKVTHYESACEKIDWYGKRFGIETWHKVLKSGCAVEACQLEHADRLKPFLSVFSIVGVRLMHVAYLARERPELPAASVLTHEELEALHVRLKMTLAPQEPLTLKDVVRMIGNLGGHLGRKSDGEPGMLVIWRGWTRMYEDVVVLNNYKRIAA